MIGTVLEVSISSAAVIAVLLLIMPFLERNFSAHSRYIIWLIIAVRLLIPLNIHLPKPPVKVVPPDIHVSYDMRTHSPEDAERISRLEEYGIKDVRVSFSADEAAAAVWAAGALGVLAYHLAGCWVFRRRVGKCAYDAGIDERIPVKICPVISSPLLMGFFRPMILLPEEDYTDKELEVILTHEMTHYRRHDLWYKLILVLAVSAHWFNPLVHLMVRRAQKDIEYSCDERVIRGRDTEYKKLYSMTILHYMRRKSARAFQRKERQI